MMALVSSEELANDVTGAEALLERHQVTYLFYFLLVNIFCVLNIFFVIYNYLIYITIICFSRNKKNWAVLMLFFEHK